LRKSDETVKFSKLSTGIGSQTTDDFSPTNSNITGIPIVQSTLSTSASSFSPKNGVQPLSQSKDDFATRPRVGSYGNIEKRKLQPYNDPRDPPYVKKEYPNNRVEFNKRFPTAKPNPGYDDLKRTYPTDELNKKPLQFRPKTNFTASSDQIRGIGPKARPSFGQDDIGIKSLNKYSQTPEPKPKKNQCWYYWKWQKIVRQ